ncbi:alanine--tRNA ligase-related protein [Nonomuraea sp. NPDC049607]|uniref:alanine--tRNA ligase-related protein n=1 Tax=Nonomuraea sp. NPDC049607 TaxID=3154732 RepID=UPI00341EFA36
MDLTAGFTDHFLRAGAERLSAEPAVPRDDPTVLFTNSAVVAFKPYLRGDVVLGDRTLVVTQPCVRAHNLKTTFSEAFSADFVLQFNMLAVLAPVAALDSLAETIRRFFSDLHGLKGSQVLLKVAADDHDLHTAWQDAWTTPLAYDEEPRRYYRWGFGEDRMTGRGATFAIEQSGGKWRDLGNLIAFEWDGRTVGYGFGIGVETLAACLARSRWVIDVMPPGVLPPVETEQQAKLADLLGLLARLYAHDIEMSGRAQGYIMRKALVTLDALASELRVPEDELLARMGAITAVQTPDLDLVRPFRRDLAQLRMLPEAVRSFDLSLRCRRDVSPEMLCAAAEGVALPDVLRIDSSVSDVWCGPSLDEDEHSVTISLSLLTRHPLTPQQIKEALRTVTQELAGNFGATLRGTV